MTVRLYRSTDASAPTLNGTVGSLVALLDAVLVNGYGVLAAAGWTKPFTGTNQAAFRNSAVTGTGFYLNVNDNAPGAGGAREARMTGFETMSAIATGTGQFPTTALLNIGIGAAVVRKSTTADSTARAWTIVADETVFYLFVDTQDLTTFTATYPFMFGDIFSYKSADAYRCMMLGRNLENSGSPFQEPFSALLQVQLVNPLQCLIAGHFMARHWNGIAGAIQVGKHIDILKMSGAAGNIGGGLAGTGTSGTSSFNTNGDAHVCLGYNGQTQNSPQYPNGPDGGLLVSPIWIHHGGSLRGYMKGIWAPLHHAVMNHNDNYSGSGNMAGKSFLALQILATSLAASVPGQVHMETSDTWS